MNGKTQGNLSYRLCPSGSPPTHYQEPIYEGNKNFPDLNVSGPLYNSIVNKEGETMEDNYTQELFDQFHAGEIDAFELQEELENSRFDGDIFDYL